MTKNKNLSKTIAANIEIWDTKNKISDIVKAKLCHISKSGKKYGDDVLDTLIHLSQFAETDKDKITAGKTVFELAAGNEAQNKTDAPATVNFFTVASQTINESVKQLIDVTPGKKIKKGIESII
jgi:hypothetical protein